MNRLNNDQATILKRLCELQVETLRRLFTNEGTFSETGLDGSLAGTFYNNLLDSSNFFSRMKDDPSLFFEMDETDGRITYSILGLMVENGYAGDKEVKDMMDYLRNKYDFEDDSYEDFTEEEFKELISEGEDRKVEFKPALSYCYKKKRGSIVINYIIAKAICGFLNSEGGHIIIGMTDDGSIQGIGDDLNLYDGDLMKKMDQFRLSFDNLINHFFGPFVFNLVGTAFIETEGKNLFIIKVQPSVSAPVFLINRDFNPATGKYDILKKEFFFRAEASTRQIGDIEEIIKYVRERWNSNTL